MEPNAFVAEVYRRMALRMPSRTMAPPTAERIREATEEYRPFLPSSKDAAILDIGFGTGLFLAACHELGYRNLSGAEFNPDSKPYLKDWGVELYRIEKDIGEFLADRGEHFDFIHMAHVIEHIPKYSLLWITDALFFALRRGGTLFLRTPNMEGPAANSCYYVTLTHEYGFSGANMDSLLNICGFENVEFLDLSRPSATKQHLGAMLRWPFLVTQRMKHRLFGVNHGGQFNSELVVRAVRQNAEPLISERFR